MPAERPINKVNFVRMPNAMPEPEIRLVVVPNVNQTPEPGYRNPETGDLPEDSASFTWKYQCVQMKSPHIDVQYIRRQIISGLSDYRSLVNPQENAFNFTVSPQQDPDEASQREMYVFNNFVNGTIKDHHKIALLKTAPCEEEDRKVWNSVYDLLKDESVLKCTTYAKLLYARKRIEEARKRLSEENIAPLANQIPEKNIEEAETVRKSLTQEEHPFKSYLIELGFKIK